MTRPSPTPDIDNDGFSAASNEPVTLPPLPEPLTTRWCCRHCGSLTLLDSDDLCRHCWVDGAATFSEVAARALMGERVMIRPRWRIG